jgi:tyrosinase
MCPSFTTDASSNRAIAVYRLFTTDYVSNYAAFATRAYQANQESKDYTSLESIHDNLHGYTGGFPNDLRVPFYGHMAHVPVAAFDPIFWIHHCNVDRLLAIWQTLFPAAFSPNYWFDTTDQELTDDGTWSIKQNAIDTPDTPLAPFHKNRNGAIFDSNDVRSWFALGHTYPELQPWDPKHQEDGHFSPEKYLSNVRAAVTDLYDLSTELFLAKPGPSPTAATGIAQAAQAVLTGPRKKATHDDYIVNVLYDRYVG